MARRYRASTFAPISCADAADITPACDRSMYSSVAPYAVADGWSIVDVVPYCATSAVPTPAAVGTPCPRTNSYRSKIVVGCAPPSAAPAAIATSSRSGTVGNGNNSR